MAKSEGELTWKELEIGVIATEPGNARQYQTGYWRSQKPIYDFDRCMKCGICQMFCPEGCVVQNSEGHFEADMFYCKGCGICARECWTKVINMVDEEE